MATDGGTSLYSQFAFLLVHGNLLPLLRIGLWDYLTLGPAYPASAPLYYHLVRIVARTTFNHRIFFSLSDQRCSKRNMTVPSCWDLGVLSQIAKRSEPANEWKGCTGERSP